jgi:hypothetical protein
LQKGAEVESPRVPKTVVVDIPFATSLSGAPRYAVVGGVLTLVGLLLRVFARWLAWPSKWEYSGDRTNTSWAYNEALYIDLGLVLLAFGLALMFLGVVRATDPDKLAKGDGNNR